MKPLDEGQQRELDYLRSQRSAWVNFPLALRLLVAVGIALLFGAALAAVVALADGPWLRIAVGGGAVMLLLLAPMVAAPERALRWSIWLSTPTAEEMKRGDNNKSWPG